MNPVYSAARFNSDIADCLSVAESLRRADPENPSLYGIADGVIMTERLKGLGETPDERIRGYRSHLEVALDQVRGRTAAGGRKYRNSNEALAEITRLVSLASALNVDSELARAPYVLENGLDVSQIVEWADPARRLTSSTEAYSRFANQLHADLASVIGPVVRRVLTGQEAPSTVPEHRIH